MALKEGSILCLRSQEPVRGARDLSGAIDLSAWTVYGICEQCGEEELFYLTKRKATLERYKSFENGHAYVRESGPPIPRQSTPVAATYRHEAPKPAGRPPRAANGKRTALAGSPGRRFLAGLVDLAAAGGCAAIACLLATWAGVQLWDLELTQVDTGGAPGIGRRMARFGLLMLQTLIVVPFWVSVYWVARDPARQGLHDRAVRTAVVRGSELERLRALGVSPAAKEQRSRRPGPA